MYTARKYTRHADECWLKSTRHFKKITRLDEWTSVFFKPCMVASNLTQPVTMDESELINLDCENII